MQVLSLILGLSQALALSYLLALNQSLVFIHVHAQLLHVGPHSKPLQRYSVPRGGAKDVWSFFTKVKGWHECVLCQ
jgi:hypothetical protein